MCLLEQMRDANQDEALTAAILGELIPQFTYAAPVLLERFERGEPLVQTSPPTNVGFDVSTLEPVLLEFFKALVPHVKVALGWGILGVLQTWHLSNRASQNQTEIVAALMKHDVRVLQTVESIAEIVSRMDKAPVTPEAVAESFIAAANRIGNTNAASDRE